MSAASRKLSLAQPTVSEQLRQLERTLGVELFRRRAGRLLRTDDGTHVFRYADEIFALGHELTDSLSRRQIARRHRRRGRRAEADRREAARSGAPARPGATCDLS
jgi:LysR family transcriptional activator of nhaA